MMGCDVPREPWHFEFRKGDRFPALRKLSLCGYDFEEIPFPDAWTMEGTWEYTAYQAFSKVKSFLTPSGLAVRETNLERWLDAMDFSNLEELSLTQDYPPLYERLQDQLPNLKRLSLICDNTGKYMKPEHQEFLRKVPPLEKLSIGLGSPERLLDEQANRTQFPVQELVESHGRKLSSLSLQQSESRAPGQRRSMLTLDELALLKDGCPSLKHLGLDLYRDEEVGWPNATFDALTGFKTLETMELAFELGDDLHRRNEPGWNEYRDPDPLGGPGPFREPRLSLNVSEALFNDLSHKKEGRPLQGVDFLVGEYTDPASVRPMYIPSWGDERGAKFECRAAIDEDGRHCKAFYSLE